MKPEANANDWMIHSHTGSRVICRETVSLCPSWGNDPDEGDINTDESDVFLLSQKCVFLLVPTVGCLRVAVSNDVCAEFDTRGLISHSLLKV